MALPPKTLGILEENSILFYPHLRDKAKFSFDFCSKTERIEGKKEKILEVQGGGVGKEETTNELTYAAKVIHIFMQPL